MMILINNSVPFFGIGLCVVVLIAVRYRTMSFDSIALMLFFIASFAILADADIQNNEFVPVWETVIARVMQIVIVLLTMSILKRYTKIRQENIRLIDIIDKIENK